MNRRLLGAVLALAFVWSVPVAQAQPTVEELLEEARMAVGDGRFEAQVLFGDAADPIDLLPSGGRVPHAAGWTLGRETGFGDERGGLLLQIIDGCLVNERIWVFAAGITDVPVRMVVTDTLSGTSTDYALPGTPPGGPVGAILDPDAFATCGLGPDTWLPSSELPALAGEGRFTPLVKRCPSFTAPVSIEQSRPGRLYDRLVFRDMQVNPIVDFDPVIAADGSRLYDERIALLSGEVTGVIEGLVFSGAQGTLPTPGQFARRAEDAGPDALESALESARARRLQRDLRVQLGVGRHACVYRFDLQLDGLGYEPEQGVELLEQAGWVLDRSGSSVSDRFVVEVTPSDGPSVFLPVLPPLPASGPFGPGLVFRDGQAIVEVLDACAFDDGYWVTAAGASGMGLRITDTASGEVNSYPLGALVGPPFAPIIDTSAFATCP